MGEERVRIQWYIIIEWKGKKTLRGTQGLQIQLGMDGQSLAKLVSQATSQFIRQLLVLVPSGSVALPVCNGHLPRSLRWCETAGFT